MKNDKKTLIVIIVVALAAYLLWKKSKSSSGSASVDTSSEGTASTSLDYILSHVIFTGNERQAIEAMRKKADESVVTRQSLEAKAYKNGYSFDQQLVFDTLWVMRENGTITSDRYQKLIKEVKEL